MKLHLVLVPALLALCSAYTPQDPPDGSAQGTCRTRWKENVGTVCGNACEADCKHCERDGSGGSTETFCKCESNDCSEPACCYAFNRTSAGGNHIGIYAEGDCGTTECPGAANSECTEQSIIVPFGEPAVWKAACFAAP